MTRLPLLAFSLLCLVISSILSRGIDVTFDSAKKITGPAVTDAAAVVAQARDGRIILVGYESSNSSLVQAVSAAGDLLWKTNFPIRLGASIAGDRNGNTYLTGSAYRTYVTPPENVFDTSGLPTEGAGGVYVAKLDSKGALIWVRLFGSTPYAQARGLVFDRAGNYFLVGTYSHEFAQFGQTTLPASSTDQWANIFVAKFSPDDLLLWVRAGVSDMSADVGAVALAPSGDLYFSGTASAGISFDSKSLTSPDPSFNFIVHLSSNGDPQWIRQSDGFSSIAVDSSGNIFGASRTALSKLDPAGQLLWNQTIVNTVDDDIADVCLAVDQQGNALFAGAYSAAGASSGFKGQISFGDVTLSTRSQWETFLTKYSSDGQVLWAIESVGQNPLSGGISRRSLTYPNGIFITSAGRALLVGTFMGTVQFGSASLLGRNYDAYLDFYLATVQEPDATPPALSIATDGTDLLISWPSSSPGYSLQSSESLLALVPWTAETSPVTTVSAQNTVRIQRSARSKFFRLQKL